MKLIGHALAVAKFLLDGEQSSFAITTHFSKESVLGYAGWAHSTLRDLDGAGFVSRREGTELIREHGNKPRVYYTLTDAGRAALKSEAS